mgnify:CR=1 FL=1
MRINHKPPRYADGIEKHTTQSFGGYNHTKGAVNGEIYDMRNMCSDAFPFICTRPERIQVGTGGDALYGMCAAGIPGETKVPYWIERVPGEGDAVDPWLASVGGAICPIFQSTLPVWGATYYQPTSPFRPSYFNPRSPCGERQ